MSRLQRLLLSCEYYPLDDRILLESSFVKETADGTRYAQLRCGLSSKNFLVAVEDLDRSSLSSSQGVCADDGYDVGNLRISHVLPLSFLHFVTSKKKPFTIKLIMYNGITWYLEMSEQRDRSRKWKRWVEGICDMGIRHHRFATVIRSGSKIHRILEGIRKKSSEKPIFSDLERISRVLDKKIKSGLNRKDLAAIQCLIRNLQLSHRTLFQSTFKMARRSGPFYQKRSASISDLDKLSREEIETTFSNPRKKFVIERRNSMPSVLEGSSHLVCKPEFNQKLQRIAHITELLRDDKESDQITVPVDGHLLSINKNQVIYLGKIQNLRQQNVSKWYPGGVDLLTLIKINRKKMENVNMFNALTEDLNQNKGEQEACKKSKDIPNISWKRSKSTTTLRKKSSVKFSSENHSITTSSTDTKSSKMKSLIFSIKSGFNLKDKNGQSEKYSQSRGKSETSSLSKVSSLPQNIWTEPSFTENINCLSQLEALAIARELTIMDRNNLAQIQAPEIEDCVWTKQNKKIRSPNVIKLFDHFHKVVAMIVSSILHNKSVRDRAEAIIFFIEVADECILLKNFHSGCAILTALRVLPIYRLKKSWDYIRKNFSSFYRKYEIMTSCGDERMTLKIFQDSIQSKPSLPFFGCFLNIVADSFTISLPRHFSRLLIAAKRVPTIYKNRLEVPTPQIKNEEHERSTPGQSSRPGNLDREKAEPENGGSILEAVLEAFQFEKRKKWSRSHSQLRKLMLKESKLSNQAKESRYQDGSSQMSPARRKQIARAVLDYSKKIAAKRKPSLFRRVGRHYSDHNSWISEHERLVTLDPNQLLFDYQISAVQYEFEPDYRTREILHEKMYKSCNYDQYLNPFSVECYFMSKEIEP